MIYIWNIYEPCDEENYDENDPFDIFVYALRKEEAPQKNVILYVEGKKRRIVAVAQDRTKNDIMGFGTECYYKVGVI